LADTLRVEKTTAGQRCEFLQGSQDLPAEVREELIDLVDTIDGWLTEHGLARARMHFHVAAYTSTPPLEEH
jgi:hypothetical protein